jgi:hypothetical protein
VGKILQFVGDFEALLLLLVGNTLCVIITAFVCSSIDPLIDLRVGSVFD